METVSPPPLDHSIPLKDKSVENSFSTKITDGKYLDNHVMDIKFSLYGIAVKRINNDVPDNQVMTVLKVNDEVLELLGSEDGKSAKICIHSSALGLGDVNKTIYKGDMLSKDGNSISKQDFESFYKEVNNDEKPKKIIKFTSPNYKNK